MNQRNRQITEGAMRVFSRYGFAKTTMNDIAREAGVARQTLYNAYAGKDEVLRAAIKENMAKTYDEVIESWAQVNDFGAKLDLLFQHGPLLWYDMVQSSPEMADMVEGLHTVAKEELAAFAGRCVAAIETELAPFEGNIIGQDLSVHAMAEFIYYAAINAKYGVPDRDALVQRLAVLRSSVLATLRVTPG